MKNQFTFLGLKRPTRTEIQKEFMRKSKKTKSIDWEFVIEMFNKEEREFQYLALDYIKWLHKLLKKEDIDILEQLIVTKSWWDTVDILDNYVGQLCLQYPELKQSHIQRYIKSENIWLKRIAINFQLQYKQDVDTTILTEAILSNIDTKEFFVDKAIGWALREYSKVNPKWVEEFIDKHKNDLSKLSIKEGTKLL
ncbi:MAG: DNA alkylation repair protein [Coprobacillaceae bacterium]